LWLDRFGHSPTPSNARQTLHDARVRGHSLTRQCSISSRLRKKAAASALGRLGNPSSRACATWQRHPSERRRARARGLVSVAREHSKDNLIPQAGCAGCTLTRLDRVHETGSLAHKDQTPARDRWLNSSWTLSLGGTLNCARGATLEGLSGWIQIDWRAARVQSEYRARADRGRVTRTAAEGRRLGWGPPGRSAPGYPLNTGLTAPVDLPARPAPGGPSVATGTAGAFSKRSDHLRGPAHAHGP
jgi:hypothetical protein